MSMICMPPVSTCIAIHAYSLLNNIDDKLLVETVEKRINLPLIAVYQLHLPSSKSTDKNAQPQNAVSVSVDGNYCESF